MTQHQKVLTILIRLGSAKLDGWVEAPDFQQYGDIFVGYKAPTRIAELSDPQTGYPEMIERGKIEGKRYLKYRFKHENTAKFLSSIPKEYINIVENELKSLGMSYEKEITEFIYLGNNTVRPVKRIIRVS